MKTCRDCGESFTWTADKPGYVNQCGECGADAEKESRLRASQSEDEDGGGWYPERRKPDTEEGETVRFRLWTGLKRNSSNGGGNRKAKDTPTAVGYQLTMDEAVAWT